MMRRMEMNNLKVMMMRASDSAHRPAGDGVPVCVGVGSHQHIFHSIDHVQSLHPSSRLLR
jgi:hypothetical protein